MPGCTGSTSPGQPGMAPELAAEHDRRIVADIPGRVVPAPWPAVHAHAARPGLLGGDFTGGQRLAKNRPSTPSSSSASSPAAPRAPGSCVTSFRSDVYHAHDRQEHRHARYRRLGRTPSGRSCKRFTGEISSTPTTTGAEQSISSSPRTSSSRTRCPATGPERGAAGGVLTAIFTRVPRPARWTLRDTIAEDEPVVDDAQRVDRHPSAGRSSGIPATGRTVSVESSTLDRVPGGAPGREPDHHGRRRDADAAGRDPRPGCLTRAPSARGATANGPLSAGQQVLVGDGGGHVQLHEPPPAVLPDGYASASCSTSGERSMSSRRSYSLV